MVGKSDVGAHELHDPLRIAAANERTVRAAGRSQQSDGPITQA